MQFGSGSARKKKRYAYTDVSFLSEIERSQSLSTCIVYAVEILEADKRRL
jgi:hypothetical protein